MNLADTLALVRPHLRGLQPYSSARDEFDQSTIGTKKFVYLDANENPYNTDHNRYPDPHQRDLKKMISSLKGISEKQVFLGNGSDEAIDLITRLFCSEADNILIPSPTYGMYKVSAEINNIKIKTGLLDENFKLTDSFLSNSDMNTKVIFLCSPNNPSGNLLDVEPVLSAFKGVVVVDEAYIDFTASESFIKKIDTYPNLIVLQTFSKAWGLAGLRLGMAFAHAEIIALLNKIKPPYNISSASQRLGLQALAKVGDMTKAVSSIKSERERLVKELGNLPMVSKVFPSEANFLLVRFDYDPIEAYEQLITDMIVVRDRSSVVRCEDCLRITIGTPEENNRLIASVKKFV